MKLSALFLALFCSWTLLAQNQVTIPSAKTVYNHAVFWHKTEINEIFKNGESPLGAGLDFVYRRKSGLEGNNPLENRLRESIRPWVHYQFSPSARFSLSPIGYMYTHEYEGKPSDFSRLPYHELRTTFQFFHHEYNLNKKLMHTFRYRFELRSQYNPNSDEYRFFYRFRYRYRIRYVFNKPNIYYNHALYASVSNEIGLNFGKKVVMNTFNQNRLYVGIGYRFLNAMRVEFRYVDRFRARGATGFEFDHGQGFMIGIYFDQLSQLRYVGDDVPILKFID